MPKGVPLAFLYDVKGKTADDKTMIAEGKKVEVVHKRWFKFHAVNPFADTHCKEYKVYKSQKKIAKNIEFHVTPEQKEMIVKYLTADVAVLQKGQLMDYSLLAGVVRVPIAEK